MHFILIMKLVWHTTPCSCLIMHVSVWFIKTMPFMCKSLVRQWLPCSCLVRHISVWLCSYLHQSVTTSTSQHATACHETQWENRKILLLCHADTIYCKIHSSHVSLTKYKTHSLKTSLIVETKLRKEPSGALPNIIQLRLLPAALLPSVSPRAMALW